MAEHGYLDRYRKFFQRQQQGKGFEFHCPGPKSIPPPPVSFAEKLRWWSWDRWKRRKKILEERDRRVQDILALRVRPVEDDHPERVSP